MLQNRRSRIAVRTSERKSRLFDPHRRDELGRQRKRFAATGAGEGDDSLQLRDRHVELAVAVRADDPQCGFVFHDVCYIGADCVRHARSLQARVD